jgi:hypothetical protein
LLRRSLIRRSLWCLRDVLRRKLAQWPASGHARVPAKMEIPSQTGSPPRRSARADRRRRAFYRPTGNAEVSPSRTDAMIDESNA